MFLCPMVQYSPCFNAKLDVLLYADDTVLIAETPENLQKQLDTMGEYCEIWKLCLNLKNKDCNIFQRKS